MGEQGAPATFPSFKEPVSAPRPSLDVDFFWLVKLARAVTFGPSERIGLVVLLLRWVSLDLCAILKLIHLRHHRVWQLLGTLGQIEVFFV